MTTSRYVHGTDPAEQARRGGRSIFLEGRNRHGEPHLQPEVHAKTQEWLGPDGKGLADWPRIKPGA